VNRYTSTLRRLVVPTVTLALILVGWPLPAQARSKDRISINDVSITEGNAGTKNLSFAITYSGPKNNLSVSWATADGTALAGSDYTASSGTANLPARGSRTVTVTVPIVGDTENEPDETFTVELTNQQPSSKAVILKAQGVGTILDNDGPPSMSVGDVTLPEGDAGTSNATFSVTLAYASGKTVTVDYATNDGTATAPSDYASENGTLTFNPGQITKVVHIAANGDTDLEPDETFTLDLSNAFHAVLSDDQGLGTVTNDDALPSVSIGDLSQFEGNAGTSTMTLDVTLDRSSTDTVTVDYASSDGAAIAGEDYVGVSGTATFAPGEKQATIDVTVNGDAVVEPDETFTIDLSNPVNATIADGPGLGTILDDDGPAMANVDDATLPEGDAGSSTATFTASLSHSSSSTVTVDFTTMDGTATSGSDFVATNGTLTFLPGATTATIDVTVNGDTTVESDEGFTVVLSNPANGSIGNGTGTGTITNDDRTVTHMTLRVRRTERKVIARGTMESAAQGMHVTVKLFRRSNGRFRRIGSATVLVRKIRDRDHDSLSDGIFRAAFTKPAIHGRYRCTASFAGDTANQPSTARKGFRL
jgi:Calx-beta domain-containing protein